MAQILKNNVSGVLGLALGASATSMTLLDASSFPTPPDGDFYLLTLIGLNANGQEASWEIVKVTGKASNTLTVVRAQEGTPAAAWPVATTVQLRLTAGSVVTPDVAALKEPTIAAGTTAQYWRGDKSWRDFFTDVRAATLTGLSTTTNAVVSATDTVLGALGKLQKQVSDNLTTLTSHTGSTSNPHSVTKAQVGLGNVDNTADLDKPISTATQSALNAKANPNPETLTYTYTGVLDAPIASLPGTAEMVVASPLGKERAYGILLSSANARLTGVEFPNLEFIGSSFYLGSLPALTSLSLPALTTVGSSFTLSTMATLTSLSLPVLTTVGGTFNPNSMAALTSLSLPVLTTVGGNFNPNSMAALTSLSLPALTTVGSSFYPSGMAALTSLSLPVLTTVGGSFNPSTMATLTSLSLPALTTVGGNFNPSGMTALTSISLPALTTVGGNFNPNSMAALTSISLPAVEVIGATVTSGNAIQLNSSTAALTSFTLPTTLKQVGGSAGNVTITSAALDQASVDSILERLAALDGTNGTVEFRNRTVTITGTSSTPSAAGLAAKATLVARGCTVTHN